MEQVSESTSKTPISLGTLMMQQEEVRYTKASEVRVWRRFVISCAHYLPGHPHCGKLHGHNYVIEVCVTGSLVNGMVIDFGTLKTVFEAVKARYDHGTLNDHEEFFHQPPTAENMAQEIVVRLQSRLRAFYPVRLVMVRISETPDCWVEVDVPQELYL